MLTLLLIITLTNFKIISGVEDDNKFINSLPEKEKNQFIQTIEKRIQNEVPEVKSPEGNDTNVDLYEKRLEDQGKSIQNIMRSEIENIKSRQLRSTNDTDRQAAHIDLTLRKGLEEHTSKSILFEKIPVEVKYDGENAGDGNSGLNIKNESKSDATVSINNTSAERKRSGRRSNNFEFENVTLANPDVNINTDAVGDTTTVEINTQVQDVETTKDAVDLPVTTPPTTQEVTLETTRQEVSTQADDENSRTVQGKIITTTDALDNIKLDYSSSIQNITFNNNVSSLILKSSHGNSGDLASPTTPYGETSQTGEEFSIVTQYNGNLRSHNEAINTSLFNLDNSTVASVLTTTHSVIKNNTVVDTNITVDNVDSSTILNNLATFASTVASVLTTTDSVNINKTVVDTNITVDNFDSSTILNELTTNVLYWQLSSNETTKTGVLNKTKDNFTPTDSKNIHNVSAVEDNTTRESKFNNTHNSPGTTQLNAVKRVMYKDYNETTQANVNDVANNQSDNTKLSFQSHGNALSNDKITNLPRSTSKFNDGKQKNKIPSDIAETTTLGVLNNDDHIIISGNSNLAESPVSYGSSTLPNVFKTAQKQKGSNNKGNLNTNNTSILILLDDNVTESEHKTTRNIKGDTPIHNNHKYDKTNNGRNNISLSHTTHKDSNIEKIRNSNITFGFKLHGATHNNHKYIKTNKERNNNSLSHTTHKDTNSKKSRNSNITFGFKLHVSDSNNTNSDSEKHPKYVPVYNYDPENAYFNPNTERPWNGDAIDKKIGTSDLDIIKKIVTHSESTKIDIYANGNNKSLRIKDIKQRVISASNDKMKQNSNLYEIVSGDDSAESSNDNVLYEKPLKHTLKKIREKIYKHQINNKSKNNESYSNSQRKKENKYKNEVRKKYGAVFRKDDEQDIADLFNYFLQKGVEDHADSNEEIPSETKKDSYEDVHSSDTDIVRDVAHSLESHNKVIKNKGIQKIVAELEKIQNNLHMKRKNKIGKHSFQSRFQVKGRDEKQKHKEDKIYRFVEDSDNEEKFEHENVKFEKAKAIKIEDDYLDLHANIVKDLVEANDEGLQKYDWLGTTVLIQAGLAKLQDITERKILDEELHPLDEELLEFVMNLHKSALQVVAEQQNEKTMPTKRKRLSFRIPKPKKGKYFNALNRMYGEISKAKAISLIRSGYNIENFKEFLMCMRNCLNDLHTAIRQISFITTYKKQRWFKNLKQLYLNEAGEREYLELLLHFVTARLVGLIDERVKKVTREEIEFISGDREADRIEAEFVMSLKICNELSRLNG